MIYGSLQTLSGGYLYDRKLVAHLESAGHTVRIFSLPWRNYGAHLLDNLARGWLGEIVDFAPHLILQDELNHPSLAFANWRLRRECSAPIVAIVHHLRSGEEHPVWLLPLYRAVERRYLASADGFIWNSETTRRSVEAMLGQKASGVVSYPGVGDWASAASSSLHEPPSPARPLARLVFVGNLIARKRLDVVLRALQNGPRHLMLDVVGSDEVDASYAASMRKLTRELQIEGRVRFHAKVDDEALAVILRESDLLVVPSFEGFGIVYLEAMAFGVPVIASQAGAAAEIVAQGENGYLVPLGDAAEITRLLHLIDGDPALLARLRGNARGTFERFPDWEESGENSRRWLEGFVGGRGSGR